MKTKLYFKIIVSIMIMISSLPSSKTWCQQVKVQGELKVTQMNENKTGKNLVIKNPDGTLGTRTVESLPQAGLPIYSMRNLASNYELSKYLCECPNLPPFMIRNLLESGYTPEDLIGAGISTQDVINAFRTGILIDPRDNKSYKTVEIGGQIWMAENLNFGTIIDSLISQSNNSIIEKYCYRNDQANCSLYGGLYQWDEAMVYVTSESTQGVCPSGWHIPSDNEWKALELHLGMTQSQVDMQSYRGTDQGSQIAGNELQWTNGALDQNGVFGSSGFNALPGGFWNSGGLFAGLSTDDYFWTSSVSGSNAWFRSLGINFTNIYRATSPNADGQSIRCVRD